MRRVTTLREGMSATRGGALPISFDEDSTAKRARAPPDDLLGAIAAIPNSFDTK
jgi:hypothetical protein